MGKEQSYQNAAKEILRLIGGKENVISAAHCATRLRLVLKNFKYRASQRTVCNWRTISDYYRERNG